MPAEFSQHVQRTSSRPRGGALSQGLHGHGQSPDAYHKDGRLAMSDRPGGTPGSHHSSRTGRRLQPLDMAAYGAADRYSSTLGEDAPGRPR